MKKELFKDKISKTEDNILEVEGLQKKGSYDKQAVEYDKLISNGLYNRIMWGNSPKDYADFCKKGIENNNGIITDIGCGTLGFTYRVYTENEVKNLFLCDLSLEMLKIGKNKIKRESEDFTDLTFLRSDALDMPFKDSIVQTVLSFGIFHIFESPSRLINEITRILKPDGKLFLSSLCNDRKISKIYLDFLYKKGYVAKPLSSSEIVEIIEVNGISINEKIVKGGMVYISGKKNTFPA